MHPPLFCFAIIYENRSKVRTRNRKLLDFMSWDKPMMKEGVLGKTKPQDHSCGLLLFIF